MVDFPVEGGAFYNECEENNKSGRTYSVNLTPIRLDQPVVLKYRALISTNRCGGAFVVELIDNDTNEIVGTLPSTVGPPNTVDIAPMIQGVTNLVMRTAGPCCALSGGRGFTTNTYNFLINTFQVTLKVPNFTILANVFRILEGELFTTAEYIYQLQTDNSANDIPISYTVATKFRDDQGTVFFEDVQDKVILPGAIETDQFEIRSPQIDGITNPRVTITITVENFQEFEVLLNPPVVLVPLMPPEPIPPPPPPPDPIPPPSLGLISETFIVDFDNGAPGRIYVLSDNEFAIFLTQIPIGATIRPGTVEDSALTSDGLQFVFNDINSIINPTIPPPPPPPDPEPEPDPMPEPPPPEPEPPFPEPDPIPVPEKKNNTKRNIAIVGGAVVVTAAVIVVRR